MTSTRADSDHSKRREATGLNAPDSSGQREEVAGRQDHSSQNLPVAEETVHQLADELAVLTSSGNSVDSVIDTFLHKLTQAVGGVGAACWVCQPNGQLKLWSGIGLKDCLHDGDRPTAEHYRILECVVAERQPTLVPPRSVKLDRSRPQNPSDESLIIIPMRTTHDVTHLLEVFHASSGGPASQRGYLRFVMQMSELLVNALRSDTLHASVAKAARVSDIHQYVAEVDNAGLNEQWNQIADALRSKFDVTQLVLLKLKNRSARVLAIADTSAFDERSELILAIQEFAQACIQAERTGQDSALSLSAQDLAESIGCKSLDLVSANSQDTWLSTDLKDAGESTVGDRVEKSSVRLAVICGYRDEAEQSAWERSQVMASSLKILSNQTVAAGRRRVSLDSLPLANIKGLKVLLGATVLLAISLIPVPQKFEAKAVLRPKQMVAYYAPVSSTVESILVREGEQVEKGQPILRLNSDELKGQDVRYSAEVARLSDLVADLRDTLGKQSELSNETIAKLKLQQHNYELELAATKELQILVEKQIEKLTVTAKQAGVVSTFGQAGSLLGKPVKQGDRLVATIPNNTTWMFELEIPQRRWGTILESYSKLQNAYPNGLPVQVSMLGNSVDLLSCELIPEGESVSSSIFRQDADEAVVKAYVGAFGEELPIVKDGAIGTAAIDCGRVSLGWLLVRDAYLTLTSKIRMLW